LHRLQSSDCSGEARQRRQIGQVCHANRQLPQLGQPLQLAQLGCQRVRNRRGIVPLVRFVNRAVQQPNFPTEIQRPQVPQLEQLRRQRGQAQPAQVEEPRPRLRLRGDALAGDALSVAPLRHGADSATPDHCA